MSNDHIAPIVAKLTNNGGSSLRETIQRRWSKELRADAMAIDTGSGKYTTLSRIGVERHLVKHGCAEMRSGENRVVEYCFITPLGKEVAAYLIANWDDLTFRDGRRR